MRRCSKLTYYRDAQQTCGSGHYWAMVPLPAATALDD